MEIVDANATEIGYSSNNGGLNNQTFALLGLFCRAYQEKKSVVLPLMTIKDHVSKNDRYVALRNIFDIESLRKLAHSHGFDLVDKNPRYFDEVQVAPEKNGWKYFGAGASRTSEVARGIARDPELGNFVFDFFSHLIPLVRRSPIVAALKERVFVQEGIDVIAQFRIETDWKRHSDAMKARQTKPEDLYLEPPQIVKKIVNTLPGTKTILVTSDEAAMPWTKEEIARSCLDELGVVLFWKSDFLKPDDLAFFNNLELSLIDQEMAVSSRNFIGITRSTFANMTTFLKFAKTREHIKTDYFYNTADEFLKQRNDNGGWDYPNWAANPWEHPEYGWPR